MNVSSIGCRGESLTTMNCVELLAFVWELKITFTPSFCLASLFSISCESDPWPKLLPTFLLLSIIFVRCHMTKHCSQQLSPEPCCCLPLLGVSSPFCSSRGSHLLALCLVSACMAWCWWWSLLTPFPEGQQMEHRRSHYPDAAQCSDINPCKD